MYFNVNTEALTEFTESFNNVFVGFGAGNKFLGGVEWNSYEAISDWQQIEVVISFDGGALMSININAA
ncbi:MAG TPA: hypothetical protein DCW93_10125 [Saprospirales bacterium]|nr:hypothetical protein [Saprospirales bacterium]